MILLYRWERGDLFHRGHICQEPCWTGAIWGGAIWGGPSRPGLSLGESTLTNMIYQIYEITKATWLRPDMNIHDSPNSENKGAFSVLFGFHPKFLTFLVEPQVFVTSHLDYMCNSIQRIQQPTVCNEDTGSMQYDIFSPSEGGTVRIFLEISQGRNQRDIPRKILTVPTSDSENHIPSKIGGMSEELYVPHVAPRVVCVKWHFL